MAEARTGFVTDRLIPALRSGRFQQVTASLCQGPNLRCAEGVAVDMAMDIGALPGALWIEDDDRWSWEYQGLSSSYCLPRDVITLLGDVTIRDPRDGKMVFYLSTANDNGLTFEEIAAALEEAPPTLSEQEAVAALAHWLATEAQIA